AGGERGRPEPRITPARPFPPRIGTPLEPLARSRGAVRPTGRHSSVRHPPLPSPSTTQGRGRVRATRRRRVPRPGARRGPQGRVLLHGARDARGRGGAGPGAVAYLAGRSKPRARH